MGGYPDAFPTSIDQKCYDNMDEFIVYQNAKQSGCNQDNNGDSSSNTCPPRVESFSQADGCFTDYDVCKKLFGSEADTRLHKECLISQYDRSVNDEHMHPSLMV